MDTTKDAIEYIQHYKAPFWRIMNGTAKVGEHTTDNLEQSIEDFKTALRFLPEGKYKLKACDKANVYNNALETNFTKGASSAHETPTTMMQGISTNAYGIPDHIKKEIEAQAKKDFMLEQLRDEVRDLKESVKKIEQFLKDDADGDGTPDIFQNAQSAISTVQKLGEVKKVFSGSSVFGD